VTHLKYLLSKIPCHESIDVFYVCRLCSLCRYASTCCTLTCFLFKCRESSKIAFYLYRMRSNQLHPNMSVKRTKTSLEGSFSWLEKTKIFRHSLKKTKPQVLWTGHMILTDLCCDVIVMLMDLCCDVIVKSKMTHQVIFLPKSKKGNRHSLLIFPIFVCF
jgi:hypothetical protein